ncbi:phage tail assembly protein [Tianweitania sp. BSSL-BM11]|uniref:Phage tail assembly protein n=1 Tax=Tianweitania aestuarii TaxID=2814886 RepID=A0ABS5RSZ8_9HYPH|nr:phage tail assembly protein [Tianweitania aestuarii]MBS9720174.1 phage tail assembly protein [Tianweitania aestuarii]
MSKIVPLSRCYTVGSAVFDTLTIREPKLSDYRQIGRVAELQRGVIVIFPEAIWAYSERLLQDLPPGALSELDLDDAMAVEDAILDFFSEARARLNKRASSSSDSAGDQAMSTA